MLLDKGLTNYWGYNTIGFFAPEPRYTRRRTSIDEFKAMVAHLHDAGLEVILDVVYNHTAEGNERGPTLSFTRHRQRQLLPADAGRTRYYINDTGTGNTLNLSPSAGAADGHRQPALLGDGDAGGRIPLRPRHHPRRASPYGFDEGGGFLDTCRQDPVLSSVKLIAEPWDFGPGGYQVGAFPPGWAEWNDRFRDTVRGVLEGRRGAARRDWRRGSAPRPTCSTGAAASRGPA